jgi:hypothetical protein
VFAPASSLRLRLARERATALRCTLPLPPERATQAGAKPAWGWSSQLANRPHLKSPIPPSLVFVQQLLRNTSYIVDGSSVCHSDLDELILQLPQSLPPASASWTDTARRMSHGVPRTQSLMPQEHHWLEEPAVYFFRQFKTH